MPNQDLLKDDHEAIGEIFDRTLAALESGEKGRAFESLDYLYARLAIHIRAEHLHLFPSLLRAISLHPDGSRSVGGDTLFRDVIGRLREDHNFFMAELKAIIKKVRSSANAETVALMRGTFLSEKKRLEHLGERLTSHDQIEEVRVYSIVDLVLSPADAADLRQQMAKELDNLPPRFVEVQGNEG